MRTIVVQICTLGLLLFGIPPAAASPGAADAGLASQPARPVEVQRIGGADRYETAVGTALASFEDGCWIEASFISDGNPDREFVETCIEETGGRSWALARGDSFADALGLASTGQTPLLITPKDGLPPAMEALRGRIGGNARILGEVDVISGEVDRQALDGYARRVERLSGPTRYHTAVAAARDNWALVSDQSTPFDQILITDGEDWPDALGAGMFAGPNTVVLPVQTDRLPEPVAELLTDAAGRETQITIVGGPAAVSASVEAEIGAITISPIRRVAGPDRYATARELATVFLAEQRPLTFRSGTPEHSVVIVRSDTFADAITAPNLFTRSAPILLAQSATELGAANEAWLRDNAGQIAVLTGLGTSEVLANSVLDQAYQAVCDGGADCMD